MEKLRPLSNDHSNCFKFAFVRNPWGRLVSTYENKVRQQWESEHFTNVQYRIQFYEQFKGGSFKEFTRWIGLNGNHHERHIQQQTSLVPYDLVDFIGKFESLESNFKKLCQKMEITFHSLPHENSSTRSCQIPLHKHYTEYYDDETREIVAKKYAKDIEYFGYEFEN